MEVNLLFYGLSARRSCASDERSQSRAVREREAHHLATLVGGFGALWSDG
jgi:hypothetical protein